MDYLEYIERHIKDRRLKVIAISCELSYATVWRIANGKGHQCKYDVVKKIYDYLGGSHAK